MKKKTLLFLGAIILLMFGFAYASVPLYRLFCQVTGYGGTVQRVDSVISPPTIQTIIKVRLESSIGNNLPWKFHPLPPTQLDATIGEPVLAFYQATNDCDQTIRGIATYNIIPQEAGIYFNKIQCFCFEEQQLQAGETIEMPVIFFIHPDILDSPFRNITLSYTFFPSSTKQ